MTDLPNFPIPPFPEDATMFFCIGAQKAGTSWLHEYLSRSDEVHFSPNKELHYFDVRSGHGKLSLQIRIDVAKHAIDRLSAETGRLNPMQMKRLQEAVALLSIYSETGHGEGRHRHYLDYLLAGRQGQPVVGDITPAYAVLKRHHFADMATIGRAKFLFILRDPISRMWSQIRMAVLFGEGKGITDPDALLEACVKRAQNLIEIGRLPKVERANYMRTLTELEAAVPSERICYVFYEDLFSGKATQEICDFLGIRHLPPDTDTRVNEGMKVPLPDDLRQVFRDTFAPQYDGIRTRFGDRVPEKWAV